MYSELEGIGLTKSEVIVYTTLLRIGQSATGRIVKEARISSGKIYEILDKLIEKGLVSYILKSNVKHFSASEPHKIQEYIEKKKQEITEKEKSINALIPDLIKLGKSTKPEYSAEIHMGLNGFRTAVLSFAENIPKKGEFLSLGGSGKRAVAVNLVWHRVVELLEKKNIPTRFIVTDISKESKKILADFSRKYRSFVCRYMPGFHLAPIVVGGNQTLIINFEELSVIVITSYTVADQFRFFFESLWNIANK